MKKINKTFIAYSKQLCNYSRLECWIITIIYILAKLILDKDITDVTLASWAAYGVSRAFYYNMAKSDHQIQLLEHIDKDSNNKINNIINDKIENDLTETINENIGD